MAVECACFISPHGFGHATRTIALLQALQEQVGTVQARLFTVAPQALFAEAGVPCTFHHLITDVGLVQHDAFRADPGETVGRLADLLPFKESLIADCADLCRSSRLILCDISCLGIAVGHRASIPSILIENFTWDWIYSRMVADNRENDGLRPYIELFADWYEKADYRIQTAPVCRPVACACSCLPMARKPVLERRRTREGLAAGGRKMVLISMGGIPLDLPFIERLSDYGDYLFILAGQQDDRLLGPNIRLLGPASKLHHPDLINAADLLICKSGYSTIAECLQTRTPICCIARDGFAESEFLAAFVTSEMNGAVISQASFLGGDWLDELPLLMKRHRVPVPVNGADQAAAFIRSLL